MLLKGTLSCLKNFWYVIVQVLLISNIWILSLIVTIKTYKIWKIWQFLVIKVTIFASMAPNFSQFWCQRLQTFHSFGVNGSEPFTIFASTAPLFYIWSHWRENSEKIGAVDAKIVNILEPLTPKSWQTWSHWRENSYFSHEEFQVFSKFRGVNDGF